MTLTPMICASDMTQHMVAYLPQAEVDLRARQGQSHRAASSRDL